MSTIRNLISKTIPKVPSEETNNLEASKILFFKTCSNL